MSEGTDLPTALRALEVEIGAARALLEATRALERALERARPAAEVSAIVEEQKRALAEVARAAAERRNLIPDEASLVALQSGRSEAECSAARARVVESRVLRRELERVVGRTSYVARRAAAWCEAERSRLVDLVTRSSGLQPTYGPGAPRANSSWLVNRSA